MKTYSLEFLGPYSFAGNSFPGVFSQEIAKQPGIYIWALEFEGRYLIHYVGKTNKSMGSRLHGHIKQMFSGVYSIHDPERMKSAEMNNVWEGLGWGSSAWTGAEKFIRDGERLLLKALKEIELYQLFLAPTDLDSRELERIESGIAKTLRDSSELVNRVFVQETRYSWRREDEEPFKVEIYSEVDFEGLPNVISS